MMTDKMIDEALVELARTMLALQSLRKARKVSAHKSSPNEHNPDVWFYYDQRTEHSAAKRASLDLTRKLAQLRAGK